MRILTAIRTAMTPYFTKRIKTPYGYINFYFNRVYTVEGVRYYISGNDNKRKAYMFDMAEVAGHWLIVYNTKVPAWIKSLQDDLEKAIKENLAK